MLLQRRNSFNKSLCQNVISKCCYACIHNTKVYVLLGNIVLFLCELKFTLLFRCWCFFFLFFLLFVPPEVCQSKNCLVVISQHFLKYVSWVSVQNSGNSMLLILFLFLYSFRSTINSGLCWNFCFFSCVISRAQRILYHTILSVVYPGHFVVRFLDFFTHFVPYFKFTGRYSQAWWMLHTKMTSNLVFVINLVSVFFFQYCVLFLCVRFWFFYFNSHCILFFLSIK